MDAPTPPVAIFISEPFVRAFLPVFKTATMSAFDAVDADGWQCLDESFMADAATESTIPTDEEMKLRLRNSQEPLIVREASSERNNCLLDSMLQSMSHAGLLRSLSPDERRAVHICARTYLEESDLVAPPDATGYDPMLAHNEHFAPTMQYVSEQHRDLWTCDPEVVCVTALVHDRCHRQLLPAVHGGVQELPDPHPVSWQGAHFQLDAEAKYILMLYCNTVQEGAHYVGLHYEWMESQGIQPEDPGEK